MSDDDRMTLSFELKEKAKWSSDPEEKKAAIKELSTHGENAISELQEIMSITAYEDIKSACVEAIKSMRDRNNVEVNKTSSSTNNSSSDSAADVTTRAKDKKRKIRKRSLEREPNRSQVS
jgi:hypothetical protein